MTDPNAPVGGSPALAFALTVRFLLELALLVGVAVVAWRVAPDGWRWPAVVAAPIVVATVWGLLLSSKATVVLPSAVRLVIESVLFLGVGAALAAVGHVVPAAIGVALWVVHRITLAVLRG